MESKSNNLRSDILNNLNQVFFKNKSLALIFFSTIGFFWAMELVFLLSPLFIKNLGATTFEIGLVYSISGLGTAFLAIPGGLLSDKIGQKIVIIISLILCAISSFLFTLSNTWVILIPLMLIFRSSQSLNLPARNAFISDNTDHNNRAGIFGIMELGFPIGGALGPLLGGVLVDIMGWNFTFYMVTVVSLLSIVPIYFLQESKSNSQLINVTTKDKIQTFRSSFLFFGISLMIATSFGVVEPLIPLYLTQNFGTSPTNVGLFFSVTYLAFLTQIFAGSIADKFGKKRILLLSSIILSPLFLFASIADSYLQLMIIFSLLYLSWSATMPSSMALLIEKIPENSRGLALGIRLTGVRLGFTIGPLLGSLIWSYDPSSSFLLSSLISISVIPLILLIKDNPSK